MIDVKFILGYLGRVYNMLVLMLVSYLADLMIALFAAT